MSERYKSGTHKGILFTVDRPKNRNCRVRFRINGDPFSPSSGVKNFREAYAKAPDIIDGTMKKLSLRPKKNSEVVETINRYLSFKSKNASTRRGIARPLFKMVDLLSVERMSDITIELFEKNAEDIRGNDSDRYWKNNLSEYRTFFAWAIENELIVKDPTKNLPMPKQSSFKKRDVNSIWPDDDFNFVLNKLEREDQYTLLLLRYTGMDLGDIFEFDTSKHIFFDAKRNPQIIKRRAKAKTGVETIKQPLSSKVRFILDMPAGRLISYSFSPESFTSSFGRRIRNILKSDDRVVRNTKDLRHTFATKHAERGVPIHVLREWMGHAPNSRVLEEIYLHLSSTAEYMD